MRDRQRPTPIRLTSPLMKFYHRRMYRLTQALALFLLAVVTPLDSRPIEIERVTIRWDKFIQARHPMYRFGERLAERTAVQIDTRLFWRVYWYNEVHGESSDRQFRSVGWHFSLRIRPWPWLTIGARHHSRHWLDMSALRPGFPVDNSVFIQLNLLGPPQHKIVTP